MRRFRSAAVGATLVALILGACGPGGGSPTPSTTTSPAATPSAAPPTGSPNGTLASTFVFGGPPECPNRPFCLLGLQNTYGLQFKEFKPLDVGGAITVAALDNNEVQVAILFTSDPTIPAKDFVVLQDDKALMRADNLVPIVHKALVDADPNIAALLNAVSAALTQDQLIELNRQFTVEHRNAADIAHAWLQTKGLLAEPPTVSPKPGTEPIVVGKTNFYEQDILSELYAQILESAAYVVSREDASGSREVVFPALQNGDIDILPDYAASALEYVNAGAGEATPDAATTVAKLNEHLASIGLTALDPAQATDQNAVVVTRATATQYNLVKISDLNQPAP